MKTPVIEVPLRKYLCCLSLKSCLMAKAREKNLFGSKYWNITVVKYGYSYKQMLLNHNTLYVCVCCIKYDSESKPVSLAVFV